MGMTACDLNENLDCSDDIHASREIAEAAMYYRPFCKYGGHFDFYCSERHYGILRGQNNMYLPPGHPIIDI